MNLQNLHFVLMKFNTYDVFMNQSFRVIFQAATGTFVAVSELTKSSRVLRGAVVNADGLCVEDMAFNIFGISPMAAWTPTYGEANPSGAITIGSASNAFGIDMKFINQEVTLINF